MEYVLEIGGKKNQIILTPDSDGSAGVAKLGGREYHLRWQAIDDHEWLLEVDGRLVRAYVAKTDGHTEIYLNGETYRVAEAGATPRLDRRGRPEDLSREITPPMPAQVIRILAAEGARVRKGEALMVLSAMKMESTMVAPYEGVVRKINVLLGAQVKPGDILVEVEPLEEGKDGTGTTL